MKKLLIAINVPALLIVSFSADATLRCKGQTIEGFSKFDVTRYCGKPLMKDSHLKSGTFKGGTKKESITWTEVQQWFYVEGPSKMSYTVEFEDGKVVRVLSGKSAP